MGRIKSTMIKKAARQLLQGENKFNTEFDHNKKLLIAGMPSKSMRNKIAGYIGRLKKMQIEEAKRAAMPKKIVVEEKEEMLQAEQY